MLVGLYEFGFSIFMLSLGSGWDFFILFLFRPDPHELTPLHTQDNWTRFLLRHLP